MPNPVHPTQGAEEVAEQVAEALFGIGVEIPADRLPGAIEIIQQAFDARDADDAKKLAKYIAASPLPPEQSDAVPTQSDEEVAREISEKGVLDLAGRPCLDVGKTAAIIGRHVQARMATDAKKLPKLIADMTIQRNELEARTGKLVEALEDTYGTPDNPNVPYKLVDAWGALAERAK